MIGRTISHYRIVEKLGEGGMGVVYIAQDTLLGRRVAIKTLTSARGPVNQHFRMRFLREAQAISKLSHPHIASIYHYGEMESGEPYIVMELVEGTTLTDLIKSEGLTLQRSLEIIEQVAEALGEAHGRGIIHRDIKPSNIAIDERGKVKVLDFGLAKHLTSTNPEAENTYRQECDQTRTREGVIVGTPMYLSPEQALGVEVDARSDLFSLGSVLYECIAGRPAFSGKSDIDICAKVIRDDPPPPSQFNPVISAELDQLTLKALAKKPEDRCQSADDLITHLQAAEKSLQASRALDSGRLLTVPSPAVDSVLHTPKTRGGSSSSTLTGPRVPIAYVVVGLLLISIVTFAMWRVFRPKPYQPSAEAKRWYDEGTRALQDGTYYKASRLFEEAIKHEPQYALAHARLAEAWAELGYFDKATSEISQATLQSSLSSLSKLDALYVQGITATVSRDFKAAVGSYRQIAGSAESPDKRHVFVDLGRSYERNEDLNNALATYNEAIKADPQYAPALLRAGVLYVRLNDFDAGKASFEKAFALYEVQSNPEGMAESLYQTGVLYVSKGDLPKAREPLEQALQIVKAFANPSQEVKTLLQLSSVFRLMGDTDTAKQYATEAIDLAGANGLNDLRTQSVIELGYVYFFRSEIADATKYFTQALTQAQSDRVRVTEAKAQFALGSLHIQQDEADEGIPFIRAALPFFEQNVYRREIMQCQTLLGQAYSLKGNQSEALKAFETQLRLAQELNNRLQIALSHKSIGTVLGNQEKYPDALDHIEQSYSIFNVLGNKLYAGYSLISRADMKWRLGRYDEAQADLNLAMSLAEQPDGKFKQLWGRLYAVSGPMKLSRRDFHVAIQDAEQAIKADTSRTKHPAIEAQFTLGLAQFLAGSKSKGRQTCERAVQLADESGDPRLLLGALLALAETMIQSDDAAGALSNATKATELALKADEIESEWRAFLIAGRASEKLGDHKASRDSLLKAESLLSGLQQRWGAVNYQSYLARPDVTTWRAQLQTSSRSVARE